MQNNYVNFPNIGFFQHQFTKNELDFLHNEILTIKNEFDNNARFNHLLAGNIEQEYKLESSKNKLQNLLLPFIAEYNNCSGILKNYNIMSKDLPLYLDALWANYQKKHEFNPSHNHEGVISFVIWIKIPYDTDSEMETSPGKESNNNCSGKFEFQYTNSLGQICQHRIECANKLENTLLLFPSKLNHCVYPFYSSDDYRISVSGNFKLLAE